jgi:hypothetical protein
MVIEYLYPEICNLFGDIMNVRYLEQCLPDAEFVYTGLNETPAFMTRDVNLIYMGAMTERSQEIVIEKLRPYMDKIKELIDGGTVFLVTGNAPEIFGSYIQCEDGRKIDCLGLYDIYAKRKMMSRYSSLFLGKFQDTDIVGYKNQFTYAYGDNSQNPLFTVTKGIGLNPESKLEGVRINNFMATYVLGPILVLNPEFTEKFLGLIGAEGVRPAYYEKSLEAYKRRVEEYSDPKFEF